MAATSSIEWTDATWNPVTGCSVLSPGCTNCYAMKLAGTRLQHQPSRAGLTQLSKAGPVWTGEVRLNEDWLEQPLQWRKPKRIFVCAHGDLFHENVPREWIVRVYGVMVPAVHLNGHTFQVLTKRPARAREILTDPDFWDEVNALASLEVMEEVDPLDRRSDDARATLDEYDAANPPPGIWLGVSAEDQARADERVPDLLATPATLRFLSAEPLLGPINIHEWVLGFSVRGPGFCAACGRGHGFDRCRNYGGVAKTRSNYKSGPVTCARFVPDPRGATGLNWVIVGGESGPGARPMHPAWVELLQDKCRRAGTPFFFKQWGEWREAAPGDQFDTSKGRAGKPPAFIVDPLDGTVHCFMPSRADDGYRVMLLVGKKAAGRLLDGREHNGMPELIRT